MSRKNKNSLIKESAGDKVFNVINLFILTVLLCISAYPLIFVISASISDPQAVASGEMLLWPVRFSLEGYKTIFSTSEVFTGYKNTVFYTVSATILNLSVTLPCAYALSRKDFWGRNFLTKMFLVTMFFSGGLIPTYMLMSNTLHIGNTIWVMLLPGATTMTNIIITRTFFQSTIPESMREAAEIDGCSNFRMFFSIVLPLSAAIIAVMSLYFGVAHWNSYFNAMIYLKDPGPLVPLQLVLRKILVMNQYAAEMLLISGTASEELQKQLALSEQIKYALVIVSTIPILAIYPFIQKHFVKGVMIGAVKG